MSNQDGSPSASLKADESSDQLLLFNGHHERESMLKGAYGEDQFNQVLSFDEELLKAEWEAYNYKVKLLEPIYKKRSEFIKSIPNFWLKTMTNDSDINPLLDPADRDALAHLEDLTIEHDPKDARNVTFHFHFAKVNPYFSNRVLSKHYTVVELDPSEAVSANGASAQKTDPKISEMNKKYDLDRPVVSKPVKIDWTSKEHDLVAKKPWLTPEALEDADAADQSFDGDLGSFFNFFGSENDRWGIHSSLLELHSKALDIYAGLTVAKDDEGVSDEDDEDEDEEDDDPNAVVDLESEGADEPKKKKPKTAA